MVTLQMSRPSNAPNCICCEADSQVHRELAGVHTIPPSSSDLDIGVDRTSVERAQPYAWPPSHGPKLRSNDWLWSSFAAMRASPHLMAVAHAPPT